VFFDFDGLFYFFRIGGLFFFSFFFAFCAHSTSFSGDVTTRCAWETNTPFLPPSLDLPRFFLALLCIISSGLRRPTSSRSSFLYSLVRPGSDDDALADRTQIDHWGRLRNYLGCGPAVWRLIAVHATPPGTATTLTAPPLYGIPTGGALVSPETIDERAICISNVPLGMIPGRGEYCSRRPRPGDLTARLRSRTASLLFFLGPGSDSRFFFRGRRPARRGREANQQAAAIMGLGALSPRGRDEGHYRHGCFHAAEHRRGAGGRAAGAPVPAPIRSFCAGGPERNAALWRSRAIVSGATLHRRWGPARSLWGGPGPARRAAARSPARSLQWGVSSSMRALGRERGAPPAGGRVEAAGGTRPPPRRSSGVAWFAG
jgi:hypothetical protein